MSGIVVGIDASSHSMAALDWAMRAAGARTVPLTVLPVEVVVASGWGGSQVYGQDFQLRDKAQKAAEEAVANNAKTLGDAAPKDVPVTALLGQPAEQLIEASKDADQIVVGRRGVGGFGRLPLGPGPHHGVPHPRVPAASRP